MPSVSMPPFERGEFKELLREEPSARHIAAGIGGGESAG
jgi:hypothetical protein